jgi:hypothetical protein
MASKFTEEEIAELRRRNRAGETLVSLAREYGLDASNLARMMKAATGGVHCEDKDQSYRENLAWALRAAGETLRTKKQPLSCPNNSAWFLYVQACEEPKDFMAKVNQMEAKSDNGEEEKRQQQQSTRHSLAQVEDFLDYVESNYGTTKETQTGNQDDSRV